MKVKVCYFNTAEVEVDDKFADAIPAWKRGDYDTFEALTDELHQFLTLTTKIPGVICSVDDENGDVIYE